MCTTSAFVRRLRKRNSPLFFCCIPLRCCWRGVIIAGNFYETAAIMGLYPHAVDLTELTSGRRSEAETPWFGKHKYADGADINAGLSAKDATEEFGATRAHALFLRFAFCLPEPVLQNHHVFSKLV